MFTGLIRDCGVIERIAHSRTGRELTVRTQLVDQLAVGDSLAVNGVCLTLNRRPSGGCVNVDVVAETLERTTIGSLKPQQRVNLEPALRLGDALGGHWVQGHVEETARVVSNGDENGGWRLTVTASEKTLRYVAEKGSVAIDGVSVTVAERIVDRFSVALVPVTLRETTLGALRAGDSVNVEVDILAKYVEQCLAARLSPDTAAAASDSRISEEFLRKCGY